jgi:hypothetical protein
MILQINTRVFLNANVYLLNERKDILMSEGVITSSNHLWQ